MSTPQTTTPPAAPPPVIQTGLNGRSQQPGEGPAMPATSPSASRFRRRSAPTPRTVERQISTLKGLGDAYNVTDNQSAMVHCSSLAVEHHAQAGRHGADRPVHLPRPQPPGHAGRPARRIASSASTPCSLLSGDHPKWGDHPDCKEVYDLDSMNLIRTVRMMRDNQVFENGEKIPVRAPDFFIGAVENPFAPPYDFRPYRLAKKIVAGAQFMQTQLIYNVDRFAEFMKRVVDLGLHEKIAIFAGVGPMRSIRVAEYMQKEVAGMDVPQAIVDKMRGLSKEDGEKYGIDLCCEIGQQGARDRGRAWAAHHGRQLAGRRAQGGPEPRPLPPPGDRGCTGSGGAQAGGVV